MTKKEEQALLIFKRKIFRRIYGPKYEDGERKSRANRELEELSKGENIVKWIKLAGSPGENGMRIGCPKRYSLKNWKGRDEDPGKDGGKYKEVFKCWEREGGESW
jgi:hypothetical protein